MKTYRLIALAKTKTLHDDMQHVVAKHRGSSHKGTYSVTDTSPQAADSLLRQVTAILSSHGYRSHSKRSRKWRFKDPTGDAHYHISTHLYHRPSKKKVDKAKVHTARFKRGKTKKINIKIRVD